MNLAQPTGAAKTRLTLASLALAVLATWRLKDALELPAGSLLFAASAISVVLVAALYLLFRAALPCPDKRLLRTVAIVGLLFSAFTLVGRRMEAARKLAAFTVPRALGGLLDWLLFALIYGAALLLIFRGVQALAARAPKAGGESRFSRVLGNGFAVFALLMVCWVPIWLAFYPGTFVYDSGTQFYTYLDWVLTTHHPLLHTLLMGFCIMLGIDNTADGSATVGLAIYSVVQMVLVAGMVAYACHWLRRRGAPLFARVAVTLLFALFPFYGIWSFSAQKDILFGSLVLVFVLQLVDVWQGGMAALKRPWRIVFFVLSATLMMLMRNNGVYALCLLIPFALIWAKGARLRAALLLVGCVAAYLLANGALIWATEADSPGKIEMLSIPLQQIARTLRDNPEAIAYDTDGLIDTIYEVNPGDIYVPAVADPVKWTADYYAVDENLGGLLSLWVRMGVHNLKPYVEAFLEQNAPYYLPGATMIYHFDLGVVQIDLYPIEEHSYLPGLQAVVQEYDKSLSLFGLPGVRLLSDTAFYVWLAIAGLAYAIYKRQRQWMVAFTFLLAIWATCLIGPVAIIRYMLGFFYTVPVLWALMLKPEGAAEAAVAAQPSELATEQSVLPAAEAEKTA